MFLRKKVLNLIEFIKRSHQRKVFEVLNFLKILEK